MVDFVCLGAAKSELMFFKKISQPVAIDEFNRLRSVFSRGISGRVCEIPRREEDTLLGSRSDGPPKLPDLFRADRSTVALALKCNLRRYQRANPQVPVAVDSSISGPTGDFDVLHPDVPKQVSAESLELSRRDCLEQRD